MRCPLKTSVVCSESRICVLARESSCIGCPYIDDIDRAIIGMDILRRNSRDDAPLQVVPLRGVSV